MVECHKSAGTIASYSLTAIAAHKSHPPAPSDRVLLDPTLRSGKREKRIFCVCPAFGGQNTAFSVSPPEGGVRGGKVV